MSSPGRSVLIVDNEKGFHDILRYVLEPLGFGAMESAYDGEEGFQRFQTGRFDLVISDVHMPKMTGPELFQRVRALRPDQPVVMMTSGLDPDGTFEHGLEGRAATACLYKPFEIDEAVKAVEGVLKAQRTGPGQ